MENNTIQESIRKILLNNAGVEDLRDLPVEASIGSSMYIYDFMNSSYSNDKFELLLEHNKVDDREFLSLKIIPLQGDKTKESSCNIFFDEDYNSELILYTHDSYVDGCYMSDEEYEEAVENLKTFEKYDPNLFKFKQNSFLLNDKQNLGIQELLKAIKIHKSNQKLHDHIKENDLSRYYILLSNIIKIPKLENLNSREMFQNKDKVIEIIDAVVDIEHLLISLDDKINSFRERKEYSLLLENDNLMSSYIKANTTETFLLNRAQNNIVIEQMNKKELLNIIQSFEYKSSSIYSHLSSNDLSLLSHDLNNNDDESSLYIVAKNDNNEVMGVLIANVFSKYDYNNSKYDDDILNIVSVSTGIKFRGLGISSILFEELMDYSRKKNLAVRVSMPTTDNKNHIANKMDALEKKHSSNVFIIPYNETDIYNIFKNYLKRKNLEYNFSNINKEFKKEYGKLITHLKEKDAYPKGRDESFYNASEVIDYLDKTLGKVKIGNKKQRKTS